MNSPEWDNRYQAGITGGTLLPLIVGPANGEIVSTMLLAALGAVVSFGVSALLKAVTRRRKR